MKHYQKILENILLENLQVILKVAEFRNSTSALPQHDKSRCDITTELCFIFHNKLSNIPTTRVIRDSLKEKLPMYQKVF